jgi:hypothetical protein
MMVMMLFEKNIQTFSSHTVSKLGGIADFTNRVASGFINFSKVKI